jgi:hypoxanthine-guanine phosphoribosyltransferase
MMTTNDVAKVFDTILSTPGMNEMVKIDLKISRKNVLLLNHVIERGLTLENDATGLLGSLSTEVMTELKKLSEECLQKAGLVELNQKLAVLSATGK